MFRIQNLMPQAAGGSFVLKLCLSLLTLSYAMSTLAGTNDASSTLNLTNDYPLGQGVSGRFSFSKQNPLQLRLTVLRLDSSYIYDFSQRLTDRNILTADQGYMLDSTLQRGNLFGTAVAFDLGRLMTGLYCDIGYAYIKTYGELEMPAMLAASTGGERSLLLDGDIQAVTAHTGYYLPLIDKFGISAEMGMLYPFAHAVNASYGPTKVLTLVNAKIQKDIKELMHDLPIIPTFTLAFSLQL